TDASEEKHREFVGWLISETASGLTRSGGSVEQMRAPIFLFLNRAYEAHLDRDEVADIFGITSPNILDSTDCSEQEKDDAVTIFEQLEPFIYATHQKQTA